ncbi:unnamed protein product [Peronospora belbahrii]|uniref:Helicase C-terminal domain-containing protein n=1 Tax=Peronospora belbahrii TaxID=622444 RepID=A0ABN8D8G1_9STRA|nr:unnamed protein product [Peronospora belbahrii]
MKQENQKKRKRNTSQEGRGKAKWVQKKQQKQHENVKIVNSRVGSNTAKLMWKEGAAGGNVSCSMLHVKKDADMLTGLYWILLTRTRLHPCIVTLPSRYETSPAQLSVMLKHLGLQAVALHHKMTTIQRTETVQRLKDFVSTSHMMVLVTTDHLLPSAVYINADVVLVGDVNTAATEVAMAKFAHVYQVTTAAIRIEEKLQKSSRYHPDLTTSCLQQLQARMKLVRQIMDIAQRVGKTKAAAQNDENKWAWKLAKEADLDDDEDDKGQRKKCKRILTPDEQRLQALVAKLYVVLARKLPGIEANTISASFVRDQGADSQHRCEKLQVLGLVTMNAAMGTVMTNERTSAQTRWMDFAEGRAYGGQWDGPVRHGASKDNASLALRERFCAARGKAKDLSYLSKWAPNQGPVDAEKWGGMFGKVCGHNEVVMNDLRAFYPQEVLNSKVCSRIFPAPGNKGFDGCLEHLRFACMTQNMSMTLWDAEHFIFISTRGRVTWSKKSQLLALSLASLQCLVPALRSWTAACGGHMPPNAVLRAIQLCSQLGCGDKRGKLPPKSIKRIMSFVFGGSARIWRQIAKAPTPLKADIVYGSQ